MATHFFIDRHKNRLKQMNKTCLFCIKAKCNSSDDTEDAICI
jgi:hypothetical protein